MKFRNICFTSYKRPCVTLEKVRYMVWQEEICPSTQRTHYQGYMELKEQLTLVALKELFNDNTVHIEVRRGSQEQAIKYCQKSETRKENGEVFSFGQPKRQGSRSDLEEMAELVPTTSIKRIVENFGGNALRHISMLIKYQKIIFEPEGIEKQLQLKEKCEGKSPEEIYKIIEKSYR